MARFFLMDTGNFAVWDSSLDSQVPDANWQLIARYNENQNAEVDDTHKKLNDNTKNAVWANGQLTIDGVVVIDSAWITARENELTQAATIKTTDTNERATLLAQADAAIAALEADRDNWNNLLTVLLLRPVLFRMLVTLIQLARVVRALVREKQG